ncbi:MAG: ZIP family metal transporter [Clostridia bacterium]|nr:ZIP family metal transporter [Clostridia bacterium]MBO4884405.1 ZIP family metal transporter [Clostridia bacterium]MBR4444152.1 ZIP family metal transporter [Clostridia bacterium]
MDSIWLLAGITAIAGIGGTGLGGAVACIFRKDSSKTVSLLLSFAAGVMTAVVCFDLLTEALHADGQAANVWLVVCGVIAGFTAIALLNALIDKKTNHEVAHIDENHPRTADSLEELTHANHLQEHMAGRQPRSGLFLAGLVMAVAIALHNVPEGMVIGASFSITLDQILANRGGMIMALVIGLHNIPEGMAVAVPLISGGMSKYHSVGITAMSGAPTILGAVMGFLIGAISSTALVISLSFASGAMLYVVFGELLPESILMWKSKLPATMVVLGLLTGLIIVYL